MDVFEAMDVSAEYKRLEESLRIAKNRGNNRWANDVAKKFAKGGTSNA